MKAKTWIITGALASVALFGGACRDTAMNENESLEEGVGGSGYQEPRVGDGKIGRENGVIDDGEGPLEGNRGKADDKIGNNPGVINDGEGPIEKHQDN